MLIRTFVFIIVTSALKPNFSTIGAKMSYKSIDFEVFGRVQGVFFRKCTKEQADRLGVKGWCKNTSQGTVQGHLQGSEDNVEAMMDWLKTTGSPASEIQKVEFRNDKDITEMTYTEFSIRRD